MSEKKQNSGGFKFYEYVLYWLVTAVVLILAIPVLLFKFAGFLINSMRAPFKSIRNLVGFLLIILILAAGITAYEIFVPYDIGKATQSVMFEEGDSFAGLMNDLEKNGILRGRYLFRLIAINRGIDKIVIPGRYDFSGRISMYYILRKLAEHDIATLLLTIPEGLSIFKVAGLFSRNMGIDSVAFVTRATDTSFSRAKYGVNGLPGYLFPDTYRFFYGIKIDGIFDVLVGEFNRRTAGLFDSLPPGLFSREQVLTLASIIEAEAVKNDEMPLISSVYHNRLQRKMLLQADPTVLYAMGGAYKPLRYIDLKFDSPFNTYLHKGLPPAPINSPGIEAIRAAIHPEKTDYLYFVADGKGRHIFSRTLNEHNHAKYKVKREKMERENNQL